MSEEPKQRLAPTRKLLILAAAGLSALGMVLYVVLAMLAPDLSGDFVQVILVLVGILGGMASTARNDGGD